METEKYIKAIMIETIDGYSLLIDPKDEVISKELRTTGKYAEFQLNFIKRLIKRDYRLLIVGAHIGTFVIPLSRLCRTITAIEANPETYNLLKKNIALNDCDNCNVYNFAAQDKEGDLSFLQNSHNTGGSKRMPEIYQDMYYYDNPKKILVKGARLDKKFPNDIFDLIIMDIEGSEYFALLGMKEILKRASYLVIEFLPHHLKFVSNVGLNQFYALLTDFNNMYIPSANIRFKDSDIYGVLKYMFDNDIGNDGLVFFKT